MQGVFLKKNTTLQNKFQQFIRYITIMLEFNILIKYILIKYTLIKYILIY